MLEGDWFPRANTLFLMHGANEPSDLSLPPLFRKHPLPVELEMPPTTVVLNYVRKFFSHSHTKDGASSPSSVLPPLSFFFFFLFLFLLLLLSSFLIISLLLHLLSLTGRSQLSCCEDA